MVYDERVDFDEISNARKGPIMQGTRRRLESLKSYYEDPNYCKQCNSIIQFIDQSFRDVKKQKYCSKSCALKDREEGLSGPDKEKPIIECEGCGNEFEKPRDSNGRVYKVKYCSDKCRENSFRVPLKKRSKGQIEDEYNHISDARTLIGEHARQHVYKMDKTKDCSICGYEFYVELCHIKAISEFDDDALIKEINSEDNLVYLCPNHHKEFDKGKIDKKELMDRTGLLDSITIDCRKDHQSNEFLKTLNKFKLKEDYIDIWEGFKIGSITIYENGTMNASYINNSVESMHWPSHHTIILKWLDENLEYKNNMKAIA